MDLNAVYDSKYNQYLLLAIHIKIVINIYNAFPPSSPHFMIVVTKCHFLSSRPWVASPNYMTDHCHVHNTHLEASSISPLIIFLMPLLG